MTAVATPTFVIGPARWEALSLPAGTSTVVLLGAGEGDGIARLLSRHSALRALVLEPDPARAAECVRNVTGDAAARVAIIEGPEFRGAAAAAQRFRDLHKAPVFVAPSVADDASRLAALEDTWRRLAFEASANDEARRLGEGRYLLHTLANGPRLARESDVARLDGVLTGVPAIVAAAGPSLDRNLRDLAAVHDRAVIIACDTAARPILNRALDVDVIVATDASRANAAHLSSLPATRAWTVVEASVHPSALVHSDGRTFFFRVANHQPWPWLRRIGLDVATLDTWASVATSAFSVALRLGCSPIIFMGADFAFPGNRPYCRGTTFESLWGLWIGAGSRPEDIWSFLLSRWPPEFRPDIHGEPVRTARHLIAFRDWIAERASALPDRQIVNATDGGLLAGPAIVQQSATVTLASAPRLDRDALHARIRAVRDTSPRRLASWLNAVSALLADRDGTEESAGLFSIPSVPRRAVEAALRSPEYVAWSLARSMPATREIPA